MKAKIGLKQLTVGMVNYCYRNLGVVEDSHATKDFHMTMDFYKEVYNKVHEKIKNLLNNPDVITYLLEEGIGEDVFSSKNEKIMIIGEILLYSFTYKDWNDPELLDIDTGKDYAAFLLDGEFLNHCKNNMAMLDEDMKAINIDVTSRMYTLLCRKCFN